MTFCPNCGNKVEPGKRFCENCGTPITSVQPAPVQATPAPTQTNAQPQYSATTAPTQQKNVGIAAAASFLFAGLGQVYNGNLLRGLGIFFGTLIGYLFFMIPGIIVWIYGIYDAYKTATKMNSGETPFVPHNTTHIIIFIIIGIIVVVVYYLILMVMMTAIFDEMIPSSGYYY